MKPVTNMIHPDERAHALAERNLVRPPTNQWHRWQIVTVYRNDRLTEWWSDLGPSENFPASQIEVPSLGEHTVGELRDIAERYRLRDGDYWRRFAAEQSQASTLAADAVAQVEERQRVMRNQSVYGPAVRRQRIGFPRRAMHERIHGR